MTTHQEPPPCKQTILREGVAIFMTYRIRAVDLEPWVRKIASLSGQPVDWHYVSGKAIVRACGDVDAARRARVALMPEHDSLFRNAARK